MQKSVNFYSGPGLKLAGNLYIPDDCHAGKCPAVVLSTSFMGIKEITLPKIAGWLTKAGYAAFAFDYRGFGESEGPETRLIPLEQVEDIRNAITFVQQQTEIDAKRIGLCGIGSTAVYAAAMDARVKGFVCFLGLGDGRSWLRSIRRAWEWEDFLKRLEEDRVVRVMTGKSQYVDRDEILLPDPKLAQVRAEVVKAIPDFYKTKTPLESAEAYMDFQPESVAHRTRAGLFIFGGADTMAPPVEGRGIAMYEKAGEPKKLVVLEGIRHHDVLRSPVFEQVMGMSIEWFNTHLAC